ncbi:hypothetical protein Cwoe_5066 [Conexibacter woesei DSM 14684]|uniref:Restriction endonuclease n=2 Tax=Conexibacter TaxID=191494 RepID=D3FD84_CONWI|nr:hypothetical protein Cwoe_5066 [Conexibacter woesei DSM 14684]
MARSNSNTSQGPFGQPNRVRLVNQFLGLRTIDPANAWKDVYRLLLWIDTRTGIAHCYESDKSQPGKPWYPRSLEFHEWVSDQLGIAPMDLKDHVDWMFRQVVGAVTEAEADEMIANALGVQESLFAGNRKKMPVPGDDPRLREIVEPLMSLSPSERLDEDGINSVLRKVYAHMSSENKRANLLGRGFEDVLDGVIRRLPAPPEHHGAQTVLETIPGFRPTRDGDKVEKVDLWVGDGERRRIMISAKWSVRADREKQMATDFQTYNQMNDWRDPFEYVWITNEFDPARLVTNATNTQNNSLLFDKVVHICPAALGVVHRFGDGARLGRNPARLQELLAEQRIIGLDAFLRDISSGG